MATLGENKSTELFKISLFRAQFLELLAKARHKQQSEDDFLLGMFSILDALLDISMEQALESLFLPPKIQQGLTEPTSDMGQRLGLCKSLESGDIDAVQAWQETHQDIAISKVFEINNQAMFWADTQVAQFV